jgi:ammonium transporter, Amt family
MRVSEADEEMGLDASQHDEKYLQGTLLVRQQDSMIEEEVGIDSPVTRELHSRILVNEIDS